MIFGRDSSLLGLAFDGRLMSAVVARRSGERIEAAKHCHARLSLDPIGSEAALAGREIRGQLDAAEIHTRRCVVAIPVSWALSNHVSLPDLSGEDLASYLALHAEREFPFPPSDLALATSMPGEDETPRQALIAALPLSRLRALENVLHAAGLKPESITFAVTALARGAAAPGEALVLVSENTLDLCVSSASGVAALRALEGPADRAADGFEFDTETLGRELRITLRRVPSAVSEKIKRLRVAGPDALAVALESDLATHGTLSDIELARTELGGIAESSSPAFAAAAGALRGVPPSFEFLPPKVSPLRRLASSAANRGVRWLVPAAIGVAVLIGGLFFYQFHRLARLEQRWEDVRDDVAELEELQHNIRTYRDWFSNDAPSLALTEGLTEAFPEEGSVWARTVTLRDRTQVSCAGSARSNDAWLTLFGKLTADERIADLKIGQVSGDMPLQFTLSYSWKDR